MRKVLRCALISLAAFLSLGGVLVAYVLSWPDFGGSIGGERLARMQASPNYAQEQFENRPLPPSWDLLTNLKEMMGDQVRKPPAPFPSVRPLLSGVPAPGLRAYWFGHSTVLLELDGYRVMTDPMLSDYAFPVHLVAPKRFNAPPMRVEQLPPIDVVTISHDHYDHLDMATVQVLAAGGTHFFVGLGVGAHLEAWNVPQAQIHELDWWESATARGLTIHCTPARHYSGRTAMDNSTLWASWVIQGAEHRVYHSGDTGYGPHFAAIGEKRGPIDLSLIKIGDYGKDRAWVDIHMTPESSIQAHRDLGARVMLPIHWGVFELSYHAWNEPIERATMAADEAEIEMVTPMLGQPFTYSMPFRNTSWWEALGAE